MHHLKFDVQDFSPALFYQRSACPRELDEAILSTFCHIFFFFWMWSAVAPAGGVVHPRVLALRYPSEMVLNDRQHSLPSSRWGPGRKARLLQPELGQRT